MTELSGALRERMGVERENDARDVRAGSLGKYRYDGAIWAALTPLVAGAQSAGDALSALPRWQVRIRKREGIDQRTRLSWRGRYLHVHGVVCDPRMPAELLLTCEEAR